MQVNVRETKAQLSRLLELVEDGEAVVIVRHGRPIAELVRTRARKGLPLGIARHDPLVPPGDEWWQPMTETEVDDWVEGR